MDCMTGKKAHDTRREAIKHLRGRHRRNGINGRLEVYRCQYCEQWHIGRANKRQKVGAY